ATPRIGLGVLQRVRSTSVSDVWLARRDMTRLTEAEASAAVYLDFESLGKALDRPAILGYLAIDESGEHFRQFVLDDLLSEATVGRKGVCISASAEEAVLGIVEDAERQSCAIVSWSTHEVQVVRAVCSRELTTRFSALHRNAIDTAKPWKRALYQRF